MSRLTINPEFVLTRQGQDMVLYKGLLDLAHQKGITAIATEILQFPSEANEQTCICRASVTMADGSTFTGIGDAKYADMNKMMKASFIRMAETRAKGRAFRDALNVGAVMLEEVGSDTDDEPATRTPAPDPVDLALKRWMAVSARITARGLEPTPLPAQASANAINEHCEAEIERVRVLVAQAAAQ